MQQVSFPPIRPMTHADRDLIMAFFDQMSGESRSFLYEDIQIAGMERCLRGEAPARRTFLAVDTDENGKEFVAGYVYLWDLDTKAPWLGIAVSEVWKGRRLGGYLMRFAEEYCEKHGKGGIFLTTHAANVRAQKLYHKSGYRHLGTHLGGEVLYFRPLPDALPENDGTI